MYLPVPWLCSRHMPEASRGQPPDVFGPVHKSIPVIRRQRAVILKILGLHISISEVTDWQQLLLRHSHPARWTGFPCDHFLILDASDALVKSHPCSKLATGSMFQCMSSCDAYVRHSHLPAKASSLQDHVAVVQLGHASTRFAVHVPCFRVS
jgi:hypothetical protein